MLVFIVFCCLIVGIPWVQVAVTLSTLTFYCRRPTILAIMDFVDAINTSVESSNDHKDVSSTSAVPHSTQKVISNDELPLSAPAEEPLESLLGKGKSRVIFYLLLNMARAEIFLMKENDSKLATLSQDSFLTDIKVSVPSSYMNTNITSMLDESKITFFHVVGVSFVF